MDVRWIFLYVFSVLLFFCPGKVQGQAATVPRDSLIARIGSYLESAYMANKFNGVALVAKGDDVYINKGFGTQNVALNLSNEPSTRFPILSITKSLTATVILNLQDQGLLSVNDKLDKYFPDYQHARKITIAQLLDHTSGIYNFTNDIGEEDSALVNHPIDRKRVLDVFWTKPLDHKPGKFYSYNNSGYFLLGLIIEKVTGQPYEQVVRRVIFEPLGMKESGFDFINLPVKTRAMGYQYLNDEVQKPYKHYDSTLAYSAGSVYSTTSDMFKFARAVAGKKILKEQTWKEAVTPRKGNYGYGWQIDHFHGSKYIRHSGGYPGFMSELIYYPEADITIILLNNFGDYDNSIWPVAMGLSSIVFNKPYDKWVKHKVIELEAEKLRSYAGTYAMSGKSTFSIREKDNKLYVSFPRLPEFELFPVSDNLFVFKNFNTSFRFRANDSGAVSHVTIHEHGKDMEFMKVVGKG